eukprot:scaffold556551_cov42-Prasinocladus_malaysianus.AAC.1
MMEVLARATRLTELELCFDKFADSDDSSDTPPPPQGFLMAIFAVIPCTITRLVIDNVNFSIEDDLNALSHCKSLTSLEMYNCFCFKPLDSRTLRCPLKRLVHPYILGDDPDDLYSILGFHSLENLTVSAYTLNDFVRQLPERLPGLTALSLNEWVDITVEAAAPLSLLTNLTRLELLAATDVDS